MHSLLKKAGTIILVLMMLVFTACASKTGGNKQDFSGTWEGTITVDGMRMPGKMILDLDRNGKGSARFGFADELTRGSIDVLLDKENALEGEGRADGMDFELDGKFYELEDEWVFAGQLVIDEGYETSYTTVEFFREGSASIPAPEDLIDDSVYIGEASLQDTGNSIDFSGEWTGIQLIAEVSGTNAEEYKDMEDLTLDCRMILSLPDYSTGNADLYFADELSGPGLEAVAVQDRLMLAGTLWGDSFEWYGTFEYDEDAGEWALVGGGDIVDTTADVVFHIVLRLSQAAADVPQGQPEQVSGGGSPSVDAPLDEFLIGCWMAPPSNVMVERKVLAIYYDGTIESYYAKPGPNDTEETWLTGSWQLDDPVPGTWEVDGNKLIAVFENDSISFETDVKVIDPDNIEIEVFYTRSVYRRLPVS